jgi:hypothetical protein
MEREAERPEAVHPSVTARRSARLNLRLFCFSQLALSESGASSSRFSVRLFQADRIHARRSSFVYLPLARPAGCLALEKSEFKVESFESLRLRVFDIGVTDGFEAPCGDHKPAQDFQRRVELY